MPLAAPSSRAAPRRAARFTREIRWGCEERDGLCCCRGTNDSDENKVAITRCGGHKQMVYQLVNGTSAAQKEWAAGVHARERTRMHLHARVRARTHAQTR